MPVSKTFLEYVLEQFSASTYSVTSKRMFGGIGLYADELFVAVLDDDRLFLKVDDESRGLYVERGMEAFQPVVDGPVSVSYFELPLDILEDRTTAADWLAQAYAAAGRSAKRKRRGKKRKPV